MRFFIVLAIVAVGLITFTTSCEKLLSTCSCTWKTYDNYQTTTVEDLEEYSSIDTCSELEDILDDTDDSMGDTFKSIDCI